MVIEPITATEARGLIQTSQVRVDLFLNRAFKEIRDAAMAGKNHLVFSMNSSDEKLAWDIWSTAKPSPIQLLLMEQLSSKYGFAVKFEANGERYVPRGLADDDGNGPMHQNWNIIIRW